MMRSNGYLEFNFSSKYDELVFRKIISTLNRNKTSFYLNQEKLFFKELANGYYELIGSKIAKYLGIKSVEYDLAIFNFRDKSISGVISKDFREDNYKVYNFDMIINDYLKDNKVENIDNYMNLEFIYKVLNYRYKDYPDSLIIINNIMDELITYFLFDILIGNFDNGRYNYELMENNTDAKNAPYYDFDNTFLFKMTRFTVSDSNNYDIYDNLLEFLSKVDKKYINRFMDMYNKLTPDRLEEIFLEVEKDIDSKMSNNFKNILFLAYSRHYEKISDILSINVIKK